MLVLVELHVCCSCCTSTCEPSVDGLLTALCQGSLHPQAGLGTIVPNSYCGFCHLQTQCMLYAV